MRDIREEVAEAIKELRSRRGLTQRDAAHLLHWSQSALSRAESGEYNPSIRILEHIARTMNMRLQVKFTSLTDRGEV